MTSTEPSAPGDNEQTARRGVSWLGSSNALVPVLAGVCAILVIAVLALSLAMVSDADESSDPGPGATTASTASEPADASVEMPPTEGRIRVPGVEGGRFEKVDGAGWDPRAGSSTCEGRGRFSGLREGIAVKLLDDEDNLISKAALDAGFFVSGGTCEFWVTLEGVPDSLDGYWVQVGSRDSVYTEHQPAGPSNAVVPQPPRFEVDLG